MWEAMPLSIGYPTGDCSHWEAVPNVQPTPFLYRNVALGIQLLSRRNIWPSGILGLLQKSDWAMTLECHRAPRIAWKPCGPVVGISKLLILFGFTCHDYALRSEHSPLCSMKVYLENPRDSSLSDLFYLHLLTDVRDQRPFHHIYKSVSF